MATLTDWITAGTALLALGAAWTAAIYAKRAWELERSRDKERERREISQQASKVVALPARRTETDSLPIGHARTYSAPSISILNTSDLPLYDVIVTYPLPAHSHSHSHSHSHDHDGSADPYWVGIVPPGGKNVPLDFQDIANDLITTELQAYASVPVDVDADELTHSILDEWEIAGRPAISFNDAAGNRWQRGRRGGLTREKSFSSTIV